MGATMTSGRYPPVFPYLMALDHLGTRVNGVIVNGVLSARMDKVRHYLES